MHLNEADNFGLSSSINEMRLFFLIGFLYLFASCQNENAVKKYHTQHVIVVIVDGARWSETWGDSNHTYIPVRANILAPQGVMLNHLYNNGDTYTCPGHTAISTGRYQHILNDGSQLPDEPGLFQYFLSQTNLPADKAWVISSKDKLYVLTNCIDPQWNNQFMPNYDCGINGPFTGYREDSITMQHILQVLDTDDPNLMLINFKEPDASAHTGNWQAYLNGIITTDDYTGELWNYIQTHENYKNKTTLIITNDHGRHLNSVSNGFIDHGDGCDGCRHIEMLAMGPDFKKNQIINSTYDQIDLASTMAELLQVNMPTSNGKVIWELFK